MSSGKIAAQFKLCFSMRFPPPEARAFGAGLGNCKSQVARHQPAPPFPFKDATSQGLLPLQPGLRAPPPLFFFLHQGSIAVVPN